jgi:hypothetical protein
MNKLEHVIHEHYDNDGFPAAKSHFIKIDDELILIGCNGIYGDSKSKDYGKLTDLIVKAVNEKAGN